MQPHGSAAPLFVIHGALGDVLRFYRLAMHVGIDHPIYGVQAQSMVTGQPALLRLEDLAAYYLAEIRKIQPKGPYYLLGYSFGGTMAFEIAHQLRAMGERVELLGLIDSWQRDWVFDSTGGLCLPSVRSARRAIRGQFSASLARAEGRLPSGDLSSGSAQDLAVAAALGLRSVPPFLKRADDISRAAGMNYRRGPGRDGSRYFAPPFRQIRVCRGISDGRRLRRAA